MLFISVTEFLAPQGAHLTGLILTLALPITQERHTRSNGIRRTQQLLSNDFFPSCPDASTAIRSICPELSALQQDLAVLWAIWLGRTQAEWQEAECNMDSGSQKLDQTKKSG